MSSSPKFTSSPAGLPPGWPAGYYPPPLLSTQAGNATSNSRLPPAPPAPPQDTVISRALVPRDKVAPPAAPNYLCLPTRYGREQKIYPYIRNPYNIILQPRMKQSAMHIPCEDRSRSSIVSTWRADNPDPTNFSPPPSSLTTLPPPPFSAITRNGSEFTVYHVCRSCHHPRSIRYHHEHPVFPGVTPSPSGICHRCRVSCAEPEDEIIIDRETVSCSNRRERKAYRQSHTSDKKSRGRSRREKAAHSPRRTASNRRITLILNDPPTSDGFPEGDYEGERGRQSTRKHPDRSPNRISYRHVTPVEVGPGRDSAKNDQDVSALLYQTQRSKSPRAVLAERQAELRSLRQPSELAAPAVASPDPSIPPRPAISFEADIRRIAREEVKRYRHAERLVTAHPRAFSHGDLVPADADPLVNQPPPPVPPATQPCRTVKQTTSSKKTVSSGQEVRQRKGKEQVYFCDKDGKDVARNSNRAVSTKPPPQPSQPPTVTPVKLGSYASADPALLSSGSASVVPNGLFERAVVDQGAEQGASDRSAHPRHRVHNDDYLASGKPASPTYRRRDSLGTDVTIQPDSSISQRPAKESAVQSERGLPKRTDDYAPRQSAGTSSSGQSYVVKRYKIIDHGRELAKTSDHSPKGRVDKKQTPQLGPASEPKREEPHPPVEWYLLRSSVPFDRGEYRKSDQSSRPEFRGDSGKEHQIRSLDSRSNKDSRKAVSPRPDSPPQHEVTSDQRRAYRESLSPYRERIITERLVRSRHLPSSHGQQHDRRQRHVSPDSTASAPFRRRRGRTSTRDLNDAPSRPLQSILRSPSTSPWEHESKTAEIPRRVARPSTSPRVSFSNTVDVSTLSPPPSSTTSHKASNVGISTLRAQPGQTQRPPRRVRTQVDGNNSGSFDGKRYFYERARNQDHDRSPGSAYTRLTIDTEPVDRERALTRALSESPSRERSRELHLTEPVARTEGRSQVPVHGGSQSQKSKTGVSGENTSMSRRDQNITAADQAGPYRPARSPTTSMATGWDDQSELLMSGGRSGWGSFARPGPVPESSRRERVVDDERVSTYGEVVDEGFDEHGRWVDVEEIVTVPKGHEN